MADYTVSGVADLDTRKFVAGTTRIDKALNGIKRNIDGLSRKIDNVSKKSIEIRAELNSGQVLGELEALDDLLDQQDGRNINVQVDVDVSGAIAELEILDKMIDRIDGRKIDIDASAASAGLAGLQRSAAGAAGSIGGGGGGGRKSLYAALGLLATALIPMGPVFAGWSGALVSALAVAGAGMGAFIGFAVPGIMELKKSMKQLESAQKAVDNAKNLKQRTAALREQKKVIDSIPPSIAKLIAKWEAFKKTADALAKPFSPKLFSLMGKGIDILTIAMKKLQPTALNVAGGLNYVANLAKQGIKGESWTKFFDYLENNAAPMLDNFLISFGNLFTGIANLIRGFDPLTQGFSQNFLDMSESFLEWSKTLETNKGFQNFVKYVQTNGPIVWDAIKNITKGFWDLLKALEPIGMKVLSAVDAMSKWISEHPKIVAIGTAIAGIGIAIGPVVGAISGLLGFFGKIVASPIGKIVAGLASKLSAFSGILGSMGLSSAASSFAGLGTAISVLSGPIGWIIGALTLLGIGLALTKRDGDQATGMWASLGKAWEMIKETGKTIAGIFVALFKGLEKFGVISNFQAAISSLADAFVSLKPLLIAAAAVIGGALFVAITAISLGIRGFAVALQYVAAIVNFVVTNIVKFFKWLYDTLIGHSIIPDIINGIKDWFGKILGFITAPLQAVLSFVVGVWNAIKAATSAVWAAIKAVVGAAIRIVIGVIRTQLAVAKAVVSAVWSAVKTIFSSAWSALKTIVSKGIAVVVGVVKTLKEKITGVFDGIKSAMSKIGGWVIDGLIGGIKAGFEKVTGIVGDLAGKVTGTFKKLLHIGSPSKVFADFGRWINEGLIEGLTGSQSKVTSTVEKLAKEVQKAYLAVWQQEHAGSKKKVSDAPAIAAASRFIDRMKSQTDRLEQIAKDRETVAGKIKDATKAVEDAVKLRDDFASQVASSAIAIGSVVNNFTEGDEENAPTTYQDIINQLKNAVAATDEFAANLKKLKDMGLDQTSIEQLINAGISTGGQVAEALIAGGADAIKQIADLQGQLGKSADALGKYTAEQFYQAGVDSAVGLLNGLKSQEAALVNEANRIATKIANTLRKALDIHSPSKLTEEMGEFLGSGLAQGILNSHSEVDHAIGVIAATISKAPLSMESDFSSNVEASVQNGAAVLSTKRSMARMASRQSESKEAVFKLYDKDDQLIGTMKGEAEEVVGQAFSNLKREISGKR